MSRLRALVMEAWADLRGQRSKAAALLATLTCVAAFALVVERDASAARDELTSLLASSAVSVIRFRVTDQSTEIPPALVDAAAHVSGARSAIGLGDPAIAAAVGMPAGARSVVLRTVHGDPGWQQEPMCRLAWATRATAIGLGLADGTGAVMVAGSGLPSIGIISTETAGSVPAFLADTALIRDCQPDGLGELVVVAESPLEVAGTASAIAAMFPVDARSKLTVESQAARIDGARAAAQTAQRTATRLAVISSSAASLLATLLLTAGVLQRRRDFGRRRALGATRTDITGLIVIQSLLVTATSSVLAFLAVSATHLLTHAPPTPTPYLLGTGLMFVCAGTAGGLIPGLIASSRDPAREIRVA